MFIRTCGLRNTQKRKVNLINKTQGNISKSFDSVNYFLDLVFCMCTCCEDVSSERYKLYRKRNMFSPRQSPFYSNYLFYMYIVILFSSNSCYIIERLDIGGDCIHGNISQKQCFSFSKSASWVKGFHCHCPDRQTFYSVQNGINRCYGGTGKNLGKCFHKCIHDSRNHLRWRVLQQLFIAKSRYPLL